MSGHEVIKPKNGMKIKQSLTLLHSLNGNPTHDSFFCLQPQPGLKRMQKRNCRKRKTDAEGDSSNEITPRELNKSRKSHRAYKQKSRKTTDNHVSTTKRKLRDQLLRITNGTPYIIPKSRSKTLLGA